MATRTYRLYATNTAGGSNIASVRLQGRGRIVCVNIQQAYTGGAGVGFFRTEVSKLNAIQNANDSQGIVGNHVQALANATSTSGGVVFGCAMEFSDGDFLYLHTALVSGTAPAAGIQVVEIHYESASN